MVAKRRNKAWKISMAVLPFVGPILPLWGVLELITFFDVDEGWFKTLGVLGIVGIGVISCSIGIITVLIKKVPIEITVAEFSTNLAYLPLYIADELGYFAREGLAVQFDQTFGDTATWKAVVEKRAQFGVADPIVMLEHDGVDGGILVAALVVRSPNRGVTRRPMAPVERPEDLAGLPMRVFGEDTTSYKLLMNYLKGVPKGGQSKVKVMDPNTEASHLLDPVQPVVFTIDPAAAAAVQSGAREVFSGSACFGEFLNTGVFVTRSYAIENAFTVQRFVNALEGAITFMHANRGFTIDFATEKFREALPNAIMVGTARFFADEIFAKSAILHSHLWSSAVANRFGNGKVTKYRFEDHTKRRFADDARTTINRRTDWTGMKARLRYALRKR
jgi:ABC-type nitrate/sulfonate/bicarbonate transport system substrate-binding protein